MNSEILDTVGVVIALLGLLAFDWAALRWGVDSRFKRIGPLR